MNTRRIEAAAAACESATAKLMEFVGMVEVKTDELAGPALDWAVAKAAGVEIDDSRGKELRISVQPGLQSPWVPTVNWHQCGPLIERHLITILPPRYAGDKWGASYDVNGHMADGDTPLIAACRAIVAAKYGDSVAVPVELLQQ